MYRIIYHPSNEANPDTRTHSLSPPRLLKNVKKKLITWRRQQQSSVEAEVLQKCSKGWIFSWQGPANPWARVRVSVCAPANAHRRRSGTLRGNWRTARAAGVDEERERSERIEERARAHPYCRRMPHGAADPSDWLRDPTNLLSTHRARIRLMDALNPTWLQRRRTWPTRFSGTGPQITRPLIASLRLRLICRRGVRLRRPVVFFNRVLWPKFGALLFFGRSRFEGFSEEHNEQPRSS